MSPSMNGSLLSSLAMTVPSALMSLGNKSSASSTTYAAVSDGSLLIRDTANQQQDVTTLSHDVEHAVRSLTKSNSACARPNLLGKLAVR